MHAANHIFDLKFLTRGVCVLILLMFAGAGCSNQRQDVRINKRPVEYKTESLAAAVNQATRHLKGNTSWFFHCSPEFKYATIESTPETAIIQIKQANLTVGLSIRTELKEMADVKIKQHENGHAEICRRIYSDAEKVAFESATQAIGRVFSGKQSADSSPIKNAVDAASEFVCQRYRERTAVLADKVSARYDAITAHGSNKVAEREALNEAFSPLPNSL